MNTFASTDAIEALQYYLVIREDEVYDQSRISKRDQCIKDLLLETKEYQSILSALRDEDSKRICKLAAFSCEQNGKFEDATDESVERIVTRLQMVSEMHKL